MRKDQSEPKNLTKKPKKGNLFGMESVVLNQNKSQAKPLFGAHSDATEKGQNVIIVRHLAEFLPLKSSLEKLIAESSNPNLYFEPWVLEVALSHLQEVTPFILVITTDSLQRPTGVFPVQEVRRFSPLPIKIPTLLRHSHCFISTPILKSGLEEDAFKGFLNWVSENISQGIIEFRNIPRDGIFSKLLSFVAKKEERILYRYETFSRAVQNLNDLFTHLSRKHRKEIERKRRKLQELGSVAVEVWSEQNELDLWIAKFLELEASGWKGRNGTAISQSQSEKNYFSTVLKEAASRNRLIALRLISNDQTIAMRISIVQGDTVFSYKTAFDENFAPYSPGMLLEIENVYYLATRKIFKVIDSCAEPHHSLFNWLYGDKRGVSHYLLSGTPKRSKAFLSGFKFLRGSAYKLKRCH